jgi:hypothetical protein
VLDTAGGKLATTVISNLETRDRVTVNGGNGADAITITTPGGLASAALLTARGGEGADSITGSIGAEVLTGDAGDDAIDGGGGGDIIDGGAGLDTQTLTGGGAFSFSAVGGHVREGIGAATTDVVNVETINIRSLGQADTIQVGDLSAAGVTTVNLDLSGANSADDGQADKVILTAAATGAELQLAAAADGSGFLASYVRNGLATQTVKIAGLGAGDAINLAGGNGDDLFSTSGFAAGTRTAIDGGAGTNSDLLTGTQGNDVIKLEAVGGKAVQTFNGAVVELDNMQVVRFKTLGGADDVRVGDMRSTDVHTVNIEFGLSNVQGDREADTATLDFATSGAMNLHFSADSSGSGFGGTLDISVSDASAPASEFRQERSIQALDDDKDQVILNLSSNGDYHLDGAAGLATLHFGASSDHIDWAISTASEDRAKVDAGDGIDALSFRMQGVSPDLNPWGISLLAQGSHSLVQFAHEIDVEGNPEGVVIDSRYDLSNIETLLLRGGAASDTILVFDQSATAIRHIDIDVSGAGPPDMVRDVVRYEATSGNDEVFVRIAQEDLQVDLNNGSSTLGIQSLDPTDITILNLGDGDDHINMVNFDRAFQGRIFLDTGSGNDTIEAGSAPTTFVFEGGGVGSDELVGFKGVPNGHRIQVIGSDRTFEEMNDNHHLLQLENGLDAVLTDGHGSFLLLVNVDIRTLTADDFIF